MRDRDSIKNQNFRIVLRHIKAAVTQIYQLKLTRGRGGGLKKIHVVQGKPLWTINTGEETTASLGESEKKPTS